MNAQDIEDYLLELGQELVRVGIQSPFRILMVGGAYMLTQVGTRRTTRDIDVLLEDILDPSASPLYQPFLSAVRVVAARHALRGNWINDVIGDALRNYGPVPPATSWRTFGPMEVRVPDAAYVLALKILGGRPIDIQDARELCGQLSITTRDEARQVVDRYITDNQIKQAQGVDTVIMQLFP